MHIDAWDAINIIEFIMYLKNKSRTRSDFATDFDESAYDFTKNLIFPFKNPKYPNFYY